MDLGRFRGRRSTIGAGFGGVSRSSGPARRWRSCSIASRSERWRRRPPSGSSPGRGEPRDAALTGRTRSWRPMPSEARLDRARRRGTSSVRSELFEESARLCEQIGFTWMQASASTAAACSGSYDLGRPEVAEARGREGLRLARELVDRPTSSTRSGSSHDSLRRAATSRERDACGARSRPRSARAGRERLGERTCRLVRGWRRRRCKLRAGAYRRVAGSPSTRRSISRSREEMTTPGRLGR